MRLLRGLTALVGVAGFAAAGAYAAEMKGKQIVVDCVDLNSVDYEAIKRLEKWGSESIKLKNCGLYLRESIRRMRRERKSREDFEK